MGFPDSVSLPIPLKELLWRPTQDRSELPPPLSEELQPSREKLTPYIPNPELYLKPDLPHHGVLHGEETVILTAAILNSLRDDVRQRLGADAVRDLFEEVDEKALLHASAIHDCGRVTDWGYGNGEMQKHGPRGADFLNGKGGEIDPTLNPQQLENVDYLVRHHTPTWKDQAGRKASEMYQKLHLVKEKIRRVEDYDDPQELMLRILQDSDRLGLTRTWYSHDFSKPVDAVFASRVRAGQGNRVASREKQGHIERGLRFPQSNRLYHLADALTRITRRDPEVVKMFAHVPHRSGIALEAGQKVGLLKP